MARCTCLRGTIHWGPHRSDCPRFGNVPAAERIIQAVVAKRHPEIEGEWLNIGEFYTGGRLLDLMAFRVWGTTPNAEVRSRTGLDDRFHLRHVYEVKVSRSDFLSELRKPEKREPGMSISHRFSFAVPVGLVKRDEVPEGCGLVEVDDDGGVRTVKAAPLRKPTRAFSMDEVSLLLRARHLGPSVEMYRAQAMVASAQLRYLRANLAPELRDRLTDAA